VAKAPAAKVPATKAPAAKATAAAKAPTATTTAQPAPATATPKPTLAPIEPTPSTVPAPAAAVAPAGWYPVSAGSAQQRWWDGARWTEHVYEPAAAAAAAVAPRAPEQLRAPAGVKPGTVWFWLLAIGAPVLTLLDLIPTSIYLSQVIGGDSIDPSAAAANVFSPAYVLVLLSGWFIYAVCVVFGLLDWRELKARGVPKPFHWAWGFLVVAVGWPAVYVIGRTVIAKRRTGAGMAPLWVFIGLEVVTFIVTLVVVISAIIEFFSLLTNSTSNYL
jgi:hypothetical protein